ncbi:hypothetical protein AAG570_007688 [Ranatra chinensis]|uniref:PX domain-containing protein n=1 Tax=Ranatra chinensis TaxID=642074 RepID=A0ABD0XUD6_9HEMI
MACFVLHSKDWDIKIPSVSSEQGVTVYNINVRIGPVKWTVNHRYRHFVELHGSLVADHSVSKDILPPKKVLGNRDPDFIEQRRAALEKYLSDVVVFLQRTMPKTLVLFLHLEKFDIMFLLQSLSEQFWDGGSSILSVSKNYEFNILQVHAISQRIKLPCPPLEIFGLKYDFSNVLEFCGQLESVTVIGKFDYMDSNIDINQLPFELSAFKTMQSLTLTDMNVGNLCKASDLRTVLRELKVVNCGVRDIIDILLCDELHKESECREEKLWSNLREVDFSNNQIEKFDDGVNFMPFVEGLNLNSNKIEEINNVDQLSNLHRLYLSCNRITNLCSVHVQLKCIKFMDLSQNQISSLNGVEKLGSLQGLNVSSNLIKDLNEVLFICNLPHLDYVVLTGNPIATIVDYRVKVLERFGQRYSKICLDNEQSTQKELDTVAVLQALRFVKEGKASTIKETRMFGGSNRQCN